MGVSIGDSGGEGGVALGGVAEGGVALLLPREDRRAAGSGCGMMGNMMSGNTAAHESAQPHSPTVMALR